MKQAKKNNFLKRLHRFVNIQIINQSSYMSCVPDKQWFHQWVWATAKNQFRSVQIGIVLCDLDEARQYNFDYRGKDYATNVLSFAFSEGEQLVDFHSSDCLCGDLIFCPEVILREAQEQSKSWQEHYAHLTVHGVLHLMGYDHIDIEEAVQMETLEIDIMNRLGYDNPYKGDEY